MTKRCTFPTSERKVEALADRFDEMFREYTESLSTEFERRDAEDVREQVRAILDAIPVAALALEEFQAIAEDGRITAAMRLFGL